MTPDHHRRTDAVDCSPMWTDDHLLNVILNPNFLIVGICLRPDLVEVLGPSVGLV